MEAMILDKTMASRMIRLEGINRQFQVGEQTVNALKDINLDIQSGEYVSVMGPSGSGKSTLLNIISLLDHPSSGRYLLNNRDVTELDDDSLARIRRENIGFVFQFFHLIPRLSAAKNIEMPMILAGIAPETRRSRVHDALLAVDLIDRADHRPDQLSGGQRQRVAIARATIMRPGVLLADEPTGNLDRASGKEIIRLLETLNQQGVTLVIITHDPELGARASRTIHIVDGKIV
jgi:putative ABC transport system ATP-binding protein